MGVLIITIIGGTLTICDVITPTSFCISIATALAWAVVGAVCYFNIGLLKFYYHDFLGWHVPDDSPQRFDGCSNHATCKYCEKDIMQDSQGNWF